MRHTFRWSLNFKINFVSPQNNSAHLGQFDSRKEKQPILYWRFLWTNLWGEKKMQISHVRCHTEWSVLQWWHIGVKDTVTPKKKAKAKHSLLTLTIDWIPQITSSIISHNVTRISILLSKWQLWNVSYNFMLRTRHENWQLLSHFYCLVTVYCLKSWNFFFKSKKNYVKYVRVFITRLSNTE